MSSTCALSLRLAANIILVRHHKASANNPNTLSTYPTSAMEVIYQGCKTSKSNRASVRYRCVGLALRTFKRYLPGKS
ncbi:Uncharacterised protein [Vibrio cholerae]|nr:Uncharacterised protein [Vibrio cholerae]CSD10377.1 Uncharacterised protein [Vibrio cholerae]CSI20013.1 Uncharacterised protein [Vibrio cholerae]